MLVLNLQFWEGDKVQAMALARLIADLEPKPRNDVVFMFCSRFDCTHDQATIDYVGQKFLRLLKYTTKRRATGWPNGPNQMMGDSYQYLVEKSRSKTTLTDIQAVLLMEADCVPLRAGWIDALIGEYKACGKRVLGAWLVRGDAGSDHVNGNCLISLDFWKRCPAICHPPSRGGWDAVLAWGILPSAAPSKLIWSDYALGGPKNPWKGSDFLWEPKRYGAPKNPLYGQELHPVWFHGCKSMDGLSAARGKLLPWTNSHSANSPLESSVQMATATSPEGLKESSLST